jgi:hypothetical protein
LQYQDCASAVQAAGVAAERPAAPYGTDANINAATGLATDYLNHFIEAIMLMELAASSPDFLDEFTGWRPMSYREHFMASKFKGRDIVIAAYESADPASRASLDGLAATMTTMIVATRKTMTDDLSPLAAGPLADRAAAWLKILVTRAGAVINGEIDSAQPSTPQAAVDRLMQLKA